MASAKMALSQASVNIQSEHQELMQRISELDTALDALVCHSEVYANLAGAQQVQQTGQWLAGWLPVHFLREEETLFAAVSKLHPEVAAFTREMKRQHKEIGTRVRAFCQVIDQLESTNDIEHSICAMKEQGKELTSFMAAHMGAEERKLSTLKY